MTPWSDLLSSGRRIGRLVWLESRLFEITGSWIITTPEAEARAFLATASGHHGWHAELGSTLLPAVADGPSTSELVSPEPADADALARLESLTGTDDRLRGWRQVVSGVIDAAEAHIAQSSPLAEAASHRLLRIVIDDEALDVSHAERLLPAG